MLLYQLKIIFMAIALLPVAYAKHETITHKKRQQQKGISSSSYYCLFKSSTKK